MKYCDHSKSEFAKNVIFIWTNDNFLQAASFFDPMKNKNRSNAFQGGHLKNEFYVIGTFLTGFGMSGDC